MEANLDSLHQLIGRRIKCGSDCGTVLEILEDGPALVIQMDHCEKAIQEDSYGAPRKRRMEMLIVQVLTQDRSEYSEQFLAIEPI